MSTRPNEYTPLPWPVPRMVRVGRRAVLADRCARGIGGVEPVVAISTQAAERTQPERGEVAAMRRVVVGDARWRDAACFQAESAQWLDHKLMRATALPASSAVPTVGSRTVHHRRNVRTSTECGNKMRLVYCIPRPCPIFWATILITTPRMRSSRCPATPGRDCHISRKCCRSPCGHNAVSFRQHVV